MEPFVVKHYSEDERPTIKGNGFDGLEIGQDREEADAFIAFVNAAVTEAIEACAKVCDLKARSIEAARAHAEGTLRGADPRYFEPLLSAIGDITSKIRERSNAGGKPLEKSD